MFSTYFSFIPAFEALQRRPFEQVKVAIPVVVKVLEAILSDPEDEDTSSGDLLSTSILIAHSLKTICVKIVSDTVALDIFLLCHISSHSIEIL